jgi:hypothetical protein
MYLLVVLALLLQPQRLGVTVLLPLPLELELFNLQYLSLWPLTTWLLQVEVVVAVTEWVAHNARELVAAVLEVTEPRLAHLVAEHLPRQF